MKKFEYNIFIGCDFIKFKLIIIILIIISLIGYVIYQNVPKENKNDGQTTIIEFEYEIKITIKSNEPYYLKVPCIVDFPSNSINKFLELKKGNANFSIIRNQTDMTDIFFNSSLYISGIESVTIIINNSKMLRDYGQLPYDRPLLSLQYLENNTIHTNEFRIFFNCSNFDEAIFELNYLHSRKHTKEHRLTIYRYKIIQINSKLINGWQIVNATSTGFIT
jgi:hypothetical protein